MEQSKQEQQFNENFSKLVALLGGKEIFAKPKLENVAVASIVEELIKERRQDAIATFKANAKTLLDKKIEFDKETRRLKEEFEKKVNEKREEFTKEMKNVFNLVENIATIEKDYYDSIVEVKSSTDGDK